MKKYYLILAVIVGVLIIAAIIGNSRNNNNQPKDKYSYSRKKDKPDSTNTLEVESYDTAEYFNKLVKKYREGAFFYCSDLKCINSEINKVEVEAIEIQIKLDSARLLKLQKVMKAALKKQFPNWRKQYVSYLKRLLWRDNIEVTSYKTSITFIGGTFASNANKEDTYLAVRDILEKLRFKRIKFKWYKGDDEYTYWDLVSPKDDDINF